MGSVRQPHSMEAPPSPLSSRPELRRSVVERSAFQRSFPGNVFRPEKSWAFAAPKVMKNGFCSATPLNGSAALPFVISTGAPKERSGEICVPAVLSWECFSTGEVMGLRCPQGDEKWVLFGNPTQWKRRPPLCHLDRSSEGAQWRDLRFQRSFPGNVFRPEESWAKGLPKVMKNSFWSAIILNGSAALPFVISTGAQRSGEICGVSGPFLEMFFDRRSHGPSGRPR